jgi:hypothetical protein
MAPRKKIKLSLMVNDIWAGMTNPELMDKHHLSEGQLNRVFKHLVDSGTLTFDQIYERQLNTRLPRFYVPFRLPICDPTNFRIKGLVRDVSESGVRVASRTSDIARSTVLLIQGGAIPKVKSIQFGVACRWFKAKGTRTEYYVIGFHITEILDEAKEDLRKLIGDIKARLEGEGR